LKVCFFFSISIMKGANSKRTLSGILVISNLNDNHNYQ
jgi:hypothetical protein